MEVDEVEVVRMKAEDIDGAVETIQKAFAEDPYNRWIYDERSKVRRAGPSAWPPPLPLDLTTSCGSSQRPETTIRSRCVANGA